MSTPAFAAFSATTDIEPHHIERRPCSEHDVAIDILYCGVCHTDIHLARNEWGRSTYPLVPGHEIVGIVSAIGDKVTQFKVGDHVGVGCLVDSCQQCEACAEHLEQYCQNKVTTYNSMDPKYNQITYGGYSKHIVTDEKFVVSIPKNLDLSKVAPLLCAGITTYSPLKHWNIKAGDKVGVIGLGGLGHMGVKFAHALGAHVTMITTSPEKGADAKKLGADEVLISKNTDAMSRAANQFDFLLDTIPVKHDLNPYIALLKRDATLCIVGAIEPLDPIDGGNLIFLRRNVAGSLIGGLKETQDMLNFCGEHGIVPEVEMINMQDINNAYDRMLKSDVKYRFVIDMKSL